MAHVQVLVTQIVHSQNQHYYLVLRDDAIAECPSIFVQLTVAADQHRKRVLESNQYVGAWTGLDEELGNNMDDVFDNLSHLVVFSWIRIVLNLLKKAPLYGTDGFIPRIQDVYLSKA